MKRYIAMILALLFSGCAQKSELKKDARCFQKPERGKCRAAFRKFYFDRKSKSCKMFIWGGCGGSVPFATLEECQKACEE